ncbi:MAG: N-acetylmuramidase domain-containing protein, partial [Muribaculaceae bacterium]|nr:N-acetylmuramidase domain-containing protein [Muribaculaceae bacterium]
MALLFSPAISANQPADSARTAQSDSLRFMALTQADFEKVAEELDIPVAAIRAVVDIEAGPHGKGFNPDRTPIINFDLTMFRQAARRRGIDLTK